MTASVQQTHQQVVEQVANHLFTQKLASVRDDKDGSGNRPCMYRGNGGRSCAIGGLIPDQYYREQLENKSASVATTLLRGYFDKLRGVDPALYWLEADSEFLNEVQAVHDRYMPRADGEDELTGVLEKPRSLTTVAKEIVTLCNRYGLGIPAIVNAHLVGA